MIYVQQKRMVIERVEIWWRAKNLSCANHIRARHPKDFQSKSRELNPYLLTNMIHDLHLKNLNHLAYVTFQHPSLIYERHTSQPFF
jgi:hypothetical protein